MRMSIGVPGISMYFDHRQVKPFIKDQSKKAKDMFHERVVPALLRVHARHWKWSPTTLPMLTII